MMKGGEKMKRRKTREEEMVSCLFDEVMDNKDFPFMSAEEVHKRLTKARERLGFSPISVNLFISYLQPKESEVMSWEEIRQKRKLIDDWEDNDGEGFTETQEEINEIEDEVNDAQADREWDEACLKAIEYLKQFKEI